MRRSLTRHMVFSLAAVAVCAGVSRAQTVPRLTGDIVIGGGPSTTQVGAAYFTKQGDDRTVYGGGAFRLGGPGRVRAVLFGELHNGPGDDVAICGMAPNGTCYRRMVLPYGIAVGVGVRAALASRVLLGAYGGLGHTDVSAPFVAADLAVELVDRISAVAMLRHSVWEDAQHLRMWYRPI
jgi:hypothetical protein